MVNLVREHKLVDSNKRALLKYVFIGDGTPAANTILVDASMLSGALNTAGYIMSANTNPLAKYDLAIKRAHGQLNSNVGSYVKLQFHGTQNVESLVIGPGDFDYNFEASGDNAVIKNEETGANGDILYSTGNLPAGATMTLFLELRKNNASFSAGQHVAPNDFNYGPYGIR